MKKIHKDKTPTFFVFFGATGDLALKKIFPALEALFIEGVFAPQSKIIAVSRREWNTTDFLTFLRAHKSITSPAFAKTVTYTKVDIDTEKGYKELAETLQKLRKDAPQSRVVYYTALAPSHQKQALLGLKKARMLARGDGTRILIEKPFGTDKKTACELDQLLSSFLDEEQVCRIDHYLGKDTVRAVMDLHESGVGFSDILTNETVETIRISLFEEKGIDGRGAFYDGVGAFRDVGQNHMLEMLAVLAADISSKKSSKKGTVDWQSARADILTHLAPPAKTCELSRRGQYSGYHTEQGVAPDSHTETAFEVITTLSRGKLSGVPLILQSGKKMPKSEVSIEIVFKKDAELGLPHRMIFRVQPDQEIVTEYNDGTTSVFAVPKTRDAYANIIAAALTDSRREFAGSREIEALWNYADHVVACWGTVPLEIYSPAEPFLIQ